MIIKNDDLLKTYRGKNACEWCGKLCETSAHHAFQKRGLGGGTRLDCSIQLIRVGWWCCHMVAEDSPIFNEELKAKIAKREGSTIQCITDALRFIRQAPKDASPEWLMAAVKGLPPETRRLTVGALREAGKL